MSFPPLPPSPAEVGDLILQTREHVQSLGWGNREQLYTASQVRALLSECAIMAAARELDAERERVLIALREWAVSRWRAEVAQRPLENKHRRSLDDCWRQVMRYAGIDPDEVVGPSHDALLAAASDPRSGMLAGDVLAGGA